MTLKEAVDEMNAIPENGDNEHEHGHAENILLKYLRAHRAGELADAFESARDRVDFWYA